jgi:hypothetical protein
MHFFLDPIVVQKFIYIFIIFLLLDMFISFSYNRVTYIKNARRLFEIARTRNDSNTFHGCVFCTSDTGPSPAGKLFLVVGVRGGCFWSSARDADVKGEAPCR